MIKFTAMKTIATKINGRPVLKLFAGKSAIILLVISMAIAFTSCVPYGYNGRSGNAYIAVTWDRSQPDYLDVGSSDIPSVFDWGAFYNAWPGYYTLYYEGSYWNGYRMTRYAWEMNYDIYVIAGQAGGPDYNGADGPDTYFTLECSPYGPNIYTDTRYYKKAEKPDENSLEVMQVGQNDSITVVKNNIRMRVIYKKVEPRTSKNISTVVNNPSR